MYAYLWWPVNVNLCDICKEINKHYFLKVVIPIWALVSVFIYMIDV